MLGVAGITSCTMVCNIDIMETSFQVSECVLFDRFHCTEYSQHTNVHVDTIIIMFKSIYSVFMKLLRNLVTKAWSGLGLLDMYKHVRLHNVEKDGSLL